MIKVWRQPGDRTDLAVGQEVVQQRNGTDEARDWQNYRTTSEYFTKLSYDSVV